MRKDHVDITAMLARISRAAADVESEWCRSIDLHEKFVEVIHELNQLAAATRDMKAPAPIAANSPFRRK
jgi:hypothetical protein